jgi:diguanylate cyclase (GGDEF)-like protein
MVIEKAGYEVECVEALDALLVGTERVHPDLLIIDITTSELISEEWVARIREQYHLPETPIVLVVDRHSQRDYDVLQTGADELLVRPFDPPELLAAVEKRINRLVKQPKQLPDQPMDLRQYDAVTGLLHRDAFLARLQQLLDTGRSAPGQGGVLFLELDNPRRIHDKLTISGTDRLLREIGALIASQVGPDDVLARFGDYAFALAVCTRQPKELLAFAEQLRQGVEEHLFYLDGPALTVTLSIGASFFDGRVIDAQRLVLLREKACWIAAETSGDCVHAHKEIAEASGDDKDVGGLMGMLQEALATDGFQLFFQPIVSLNSKRGASASGAVAYGSSARRVSAGAGLHSGRGAA